MKRKVSIVCLIVICLIFSIVISACSAQPTPTTTPNTTPTNTLATYKDPAPESLIYSADFGYIPVNQLVIVFEDGIKKDDAIKTLEQIGGAVVGEVEFINLYLLEMDFTSEAELTSAMDVARELNGVEIVFPNTVVYPSDAEGTPCTPLKDPIFENSSNSSHYNRIGMENAWRIIKGSGVELSKVNVGVVDEAIYTGSDEFGGSVKVTGDTIETPAMKDGKILDGGMSHGTLVTHVIGADHNNGGMVGIASVLESNLEINVSGLMNKKTELIPTRLKEDDITQASRKSEYNPITFAYTVPALVHLKKQVDNGSTVINCSFSSNKLTESEEWITRAYEKFFKAIHKTNPHVVFVVSAGNKGNADKTRGALSGKNSYPAGISMPNVITVGALDNDGNRAEFSNYATGTAEVTLSAPGVDMVLGVDKDGQPIKASGTSFTTPQVTSAVALIQSINPKLSAADIKELLKETASPETTNGDQSVPIPEGMGAGVLKVDEAVLRAINDVRAENKQEPYTMEQALNLSRVSLLATGQGKEYTISAGIPSALSGSTAVKIEVTGECALSGKSTVTVNAGAEAQWEIILDDEEVFIRVTRLDNGNCAYMTLTPEAGPITLQQIAGTFSGTAVLQYVADDVETEDSLPVTIQFSENGTGIANVYGYEGEAQCAGNEVSFSVKMEEDGYSVYAVFNGTVSRSGSQMLISGDIRMTLMGIHFATYSLSTMK